MKKLLLATSVSLTALPAAAEDYTVLLDWFFNPDHGPLLVAEAAGYFDEVDLDVTLVEPADPSAPPFQAAAGQATSPFPTSPIFTC